MSSYKSHLALALLATLAAALPARAQVPGQQGFFGAVDGRWMWLGGARVENQLGAATNATNGPGGQVLVGYKFDPTWDVALAGGVQQMLSEITKFRNGTMSVDTNNQHVDLEVGYTTGNWRYNAGLRGIHYLQGVNINAAPMMGYDQREFYGIGPKVGVGVRYPLDDNFAVVGGLDAALIYASFADTGSGNVIANSNYWALVPQAGGELGVSWRPDSSPDFSVTVGGRIDASFNTAVTTGDGIGRGTRLDFGPFVRLAYNFSGPPRALPPIPQATAIVDSKAPNYMVFFDFDRSDLSAVARGTIRQAASDARANRVTRLQVTGHADRAGADAYNMALSLRRANAVKDELVRNGVAEQDILVQGRGESEPLIPTEDGVREPQNRRVVISF